MNSKIPSTFVTFFWRAWMADTIKNSQNWCPYCKNKHGKLLTRNYIKISFNIRQPDFLKTLKYYTIPHSIRTWCLLPRMWFCNQSTRTTVWKIHWILSQRSKNFIKQQAQERIMRYLFNIWYDLKRFRKKNFGFFN